MPLQAFWPRYVGWMLLWGCVEPPSPPPSREPPRVSVGPLDEGRAARVVHLTIAGAAGISGSTLALFEGELTETHLGRIDRDEYPESLAARRIPLLVWEDTEQLVAVPRRRLKLGERHTLAARGFGRLLVFDVMSELRSVALERLWPPEGHAVGGLLVLCGEESLAEDVLVPVRPGVGTARVRPGFGVWQGRPCAAVEIDGAASVDPVLTLPAALGDQWLDVVPFEQAFAGEPTFLPCEPEEMELGPGCASVEDDRIQIHGPSQSFLWRVETNGSGELHAVEAGAPVWIRGLAPDSVHDLTGAAFDGAGREFPFAETVRTAPPRARVILNEVLANPAGPEPASEWVELYNDGSAPAELGRLRLVDPGGVIDLPDVSLPPSTFALVVRHDYAPGGADVSPASSALLVRVPVLAKGGLSNGGEMLALVDEEGEASTEFAARPARLGGVSIARVAPDAPDGIASSFAEHGAPGASPGAPNAF